ncbi:MAG: hypothetical protein ACR2GR_01525, partial [Rhodothermales bacterium]
PIPMTVRPLPDYVPPDPAEIDSTSTADSTSMEMNSTQAVQAEVDSTEADSASIEADSTETDSTQTDSTSLQADSTAVDTTGTPG